MSQGISRGYVAAVRQSLWWLILLSAALAALAYVVAAQVSPVYEVHLSYLVSLSAREQPKEYTFDGYYALQATDLFTATLAKWASAPEVIVGAYRAAGLPLNDADPRDVSRNVLAEKTAPQLVQVTVKNATKADAERLADGLKLVIAKNVERYQAEGIPALQFRVVATDAWTGVTKFNPLTVTAGTFLVVLLLGVNGVVFKESLL